MDNLPNLENNLLRLHQDVYIWQHKEIKTFKKKMKINTI